MGVAVPVLQMEMDGPAYSSDGDGQGVDGREMEMDRAWLFFYKFGTASCQIVVHLLSNFLCEIDTAI